MKCPKCKQEVKTELILNDVLGECNACKIDYENGIFKKWNTTTNKYDELNKNGN